MAQLVPVLKQHGRPAGVGLTCLGHHVQDKGLTVGPPSAVQTVGRQQCARQVIQAFPEHLLVHAKAGHLSLDQPKDDPGRDGGVALVVYPPAPTAVGVLVVVQALQARRDLLAQVRL